MLPGQALGVDHPVLVTPRIAAGGFALVQQGHVSRLGPRLQFGQLFFGVGLESQMVDPRLVTACRDGEVDAGVVQHPLGVVGFDPRRFRGKESGIKGDARLKVLDVGVNVKAFHGSLLESATGRSGAGLGAFGLRCAGLALATVVDQIAQQVVHVDQIGAVEQLAAFPLDAHQVRMGQFLEVKGEGRGRQVEHRRQDGWRQPFRPGAYQGAKDTQACLVRQSGESVDGCFFVHYSNILEITLYSKHC